MRTWVVAAAFASLGAGAVAVACIPDYAFSDLGAGGGDGAAPDGALPEGGAGDGAARRRGGDLAISAYGFACAKKGTVVHCWGDAQADHLSRPVLDASQPLPPAPAQWPDGGPLVESLWLGAGQYHA